jgi:uncharacterized protein (DUF2164 family)
MLKRNSFPAFGAVFVLLAMLAFLPLPSASSFGFVRNNIIPEERAVPAETLLASVEAYAGLPVGEVKSFEALNSKYTTVFIPQKHKFPGSAAADPKNDSAEIAQNEIYQIMEYLNQEHGVDLVAVEGELFGEVTDEKMGPYEGQVAMKAELSKKMNELKIDLEKQDFDPSLENEILEAGARTIAVMDRELILAGAGQKIKADSDNIKLFGLENLETRERSAVVVRDYIYQKDQLAACSGHTENPLMRMMRENRLLDLKQAQGPGNALQILAKLKQQQNGTGELSNALDRLEQEAKLKNSHETARLAAEAKDILEKMRAGKSAKQANFSSGSKRSDNPYKGINDPEKMKQLISQSEQKINDLVIDQRNVETAENLARIMDEQNESMSIIQFGAGHEEGLIQEMNKHGISVIVVTPQEVKDSQQSQK